MIFSITETSVRTVTREVWVENDDGVQADNCPQTAESLNSMQPAQPEMSTQLNNRRDWAVIGTIA